MIAIAPIRSWQGEERRFLAVSLLSSLAIHLVCFGLWLLFGLVVFALNKTEVEALLARKAEAARKAQEETPLLFVEVLPQQATAEPPKEAKYYSSANSQAANPDAQVDTGIPKIDGQQDRVNLTVDNPRPRVETLQPALPAPEPEPAKEATPAEKPAPDPVGDLALVQTAPSNPEAPKRSRPTRLAQVRPQMPLRAGERMRQEGGVRRRGMVALDAKATPFGAYDAAVVAAIQQRWYDILDESAFVTRSGKVGIEFRMHYDGRITDLKVVEQDVGELLTLFCRKAVSDPAPFAPWPSDMRRMIGRDYRDVKFTFYYL